MFKNNLKALRTINKQLADKISKISITEAEKELSVLKTTENEYILQKNNLPVDDTPSPLQSATELYQQNIKSAVTRYDFIIIFGLGMGNILDFVHNKSLSQIVLYEPDINILRFTMEYVDLTKYFQNGRMFITNNLVECLKYIQKKFLLNDKIEFMYLKNYVMQHPSEFKVLTDRIFEVCQQKIIDMNTIKVMSKVWIKNIFSRFKQQKDFYSLDILSNKFKDKTALVLGAGPSLKDNIEKIKENRDKFIIFAVHKTLKTLKNNGITPDFCVIIDAKWVKETIIDDDEYLKNINFVIDIKSDYALNSMPSKKDFIYFTNNCTFSNKLALKMLGKINLFEPVGTSTLTAYKVAKTLGFKNIIFAGIDLAFKNDTAYCDDNIAITTGKNTVVIQNVQRETTEIKSITGEYIKTRLDYASFVRQFESLFAKDKTSKLYNLTTFGAFINGMKYDSLDNILNKISAEKYDVDRVINNTLLNNSEMPLVIYKNSMEIFLEEQKRIQQIVKEVDEWFEMYSEHPLFFDYASKIITKITSSMILHEYVQIEILRFTKLIFEKNDETKLQFIKELFTNIKSFSNDLNNLIN